MLVDWNPSPGNVGKATSVFSAWTRVIADSSIVSRTSKTIVVTLSVPPRSTADATRASQAWLGCGAFDDQLRYFGVVEMLIESIATKDVSIADFSNLMGHIRDDLFRVGANRIPQDVGPRRILQEARIQATSCSNLIGDGMIASEFEIAPLRIR